MYIKRLPFQGVLNILDFNRHFYYYSICTLIILLSVVHFVNMPAIISILLVICFTYGLLMPLIVSTYVYDFSNYYSLKWLNQIIEDKSLSYQLVNINAGFDETSYILKNHFANSNLQVYDF